MIAVQAEMMIWSLPYPWKVISRISCIYWIFFPNDSYIDPHNVQKRILWHMRTIRRFQKTDNWDDSVHFQGCMQFVGNANLSIVWLSIYLLLFVCIWKSMNRKVGCLLTMFWILIHVAWVPPPSSKSWTSKTCGLFEVSFSMSNHPLEHGS